MSRILPVLLIGAVILCLGFVLLIHAGDVRTTFDCGTATLVIEGQQPGLSEKTLERDCREALAR